MQSRKSIFYSIDGIAISISSLCLVHCLLLPLLVSVLPVLGPWAEYEAFHQAMVICAIPVTGIAIIKMVDRAFSFLIAIGLVLGLALLVAAAFAPAFHDYEVPMTVSGAIILSIAHAIRWYVHDHRNI